MTRAGLSLFSLFTLAATFTVAARANAYCRTTTATAFVPADYNAVVSGCWTEGTPLEWPSMPVTYELNEAASAQVPLGEVTFIVERSFARWAAADCAAGTAVTHPFLSFKSLGATDAGYTPCSGPDCEPLARDAPHVILFRDAAWPHDDMGSTLALTTLSFGLETGHIFAAVMEVNSNQHKLSTAVPPASDAYSLDAIVTHEAGHFIGLAHSDIDTAIMYASYQPGATTLTPDDESAVCTVYPPQAAQENGCSCAVVGARGEAAGHGLAAAAVAIACGAMRRRRRR